MTVSADQPDGATAVSDEQRLVMADMASVLLYVQGRFSMLGRSAFWSDAEILASMKEQVDWAIERWSSLSGWQPLPVGGAIGPETAVSTSPHEGADPSDTT